MGRWYKPAARGLQHGRVVDVSAFAADDDDDDEDDGDDDDDP